MKRTPMQQKSGLSGFTLVEILVVAALIALFAGIAIFSAETFVVQSKRKAAQADARGISDALVYAHYEYGFYPKIAYLTLSSFDVGRLATQEMLLPDFDTIGFGIGLPLSRKVVDKWQGPYLPSAAGRSVTPRGGVVKMRMPSQPTGVTINEMYDWPADPWGNPYVVYLVGVNNGFPGRVNSPTQKPEYFARVVSYGPNGIPGGRSRLGEGLEGTPDDAIRRVGEEYRLFKKEKNYFVALVPEEYEQLYGRTAGPGSEYYNRLAAIRQELGYMQVDEADARFRGRIPGIMDPGSDDLTAPLH